MAKLKPKKRYKLNGVWHDVGTIDCAGCDCMTFGPLDGRKVYCCDCKPTLRGLK